MLPCRVSGLIAETLPRHGNKGAWLRFIKHAVGLSKEHGTIVYNYRLDAGALPAGGGGMLYALLTDLKEPDAADRG